MDVSQRDLATVVSAIRTELPKDWTAWPGGRPNKIEAALIDAVLSIRTRYGKQHTGVRGAVDRWASARGNATLDDLEAIASVEPESLARTLKNRQKLSGGSLKALAIVQAAENLLRVGVRHAADLDEPTAAHKRAYTSVRGLGPVTWEYLLMLLGRPGVKADTWIVRFVSEALGRGSSSAEAHQLLTAAAVTLEVSPTALDHAVWSYARRR